MSKLSVSFPGGELPNKTPWTPKDQRQEDMPQHMPHILDAVSHMKPMMFTFFFFFLTWMYVFWGISILQILFQYKYCQMSAPDICFLLFLFPFCGLPPLHIHHIQELLKASLYMRVRMHLPNAASRLRAPRSRDLMDISHQRQKDV